jgi:hypothetical protein
MYDPLAGVEDNCALLRSPRVVWSVASISYQCRRQMRKRRRKKALD